MQFSLDHFSNKYSLVTFTGHLYRLPQAACLSLLTAFEKIGGKVSPGNSCLFLFPKNITSQQIQEIIDNTCFVCGGLMQDGQALDNQWAGSSDFGGDYGQPGTTMSKSGSAIMKKVRKCSSCGHSHT